MCCHRRISLDSTHFSSCGFCGFSLPWRVCPNIVWATVLAKNMAKDLPSYIVRNLIDAALKRNEPRKYGSQRTKDISVVIPTGREGQDETTKEVKLLLRLHKRFEEEATRSSRDRVVDEIRKTSPTDGCFNQTDAISGKLKNNPYLQHLSSKLSQTESLTKLPMLPSNDGSSTKQLQWYSTTDYPETHNSLAISPRNISSLHLSPGNPSLASNGVKVPIGNQWDLGQPLTVVPLTTETFAAYDLLPRYHGHPEFRKTRHQGVLPAQDDMKSEDAISIDFDKYLYNDGSVYSDMLPDDKPIIDINAHAIAEYQPIYRKSVHFHNELREIHLYSPVQEHGRRQRRRRHRDRKT